MSKSGDPSPSSPKKTSANKKASESKEKITARPAAKFQNRSEGGSSQKNSARVAAPATEKAAAKPVAEKRPRQKSVSGFCLQEGGAGRQKDSGKGA